MQQNLKHKTIWQITATLICIIIVAMSTSISAFAVGENTDGEMVKSITVVDGYFQEDFSPDVDTYNVYMSSYTPRLTVLVEVNNPRFEYVITGDDDISANNNSKNLVTVSVSDPMGEYASKEYKLNVYVGLKNDDSIMWTGLSYLNVENGVFSPQFDRYRVTYYAVLENNVDSFEAAGVMYRFINPKSTIKIQCNDKLNDDGTIPEGTRVEYMLKVTEPDKKTRTYYLNLYRKAAITASISDTALLASIKINGGKVDVPFTPRESYYDITVPESVTNLDVQAYPADGSDIVQVIGPVSMNKETPVLLNVLVTSPSEDTFSIYTLRLTYDSFTTTPKFSAFQMLMTVIAASVGFFAIGVALTLFIKRKKSAKAAESFDDHE